MVPIARIFIAAGAGAGGCRGAFVAADEKGSNAGCPTAGAGDPQELPYADAAGAGAGGCGNVVCAAPANGSTAGCADAGAAADAKGSTTAA